VCTGFQVFWGALATGIFASPFINALGTGLVYGNPMQVGIQAVAVAATFVYSFVVTLIIGKVIDLTIGLRVSDDEESVGLDQALHEESAYHI
jgi:ammonium transporter, Amt family